MASGLSFFSSPPHSTSNPWPRDIATPFFTPQQPSRKSNWGASSSPSPLRTSRNANAMGGVGVDGAGSGKHWNDTADENKHQSEAGLIFQDASTTSFTNYVDNEENIPTTSVAPPRFTTSSFTSNAPSTITPSFSFGAPATTLFTQNQPLTVQDRAPQFQFAARARSSSPATLLQSHTRENRDERKRLFLDRLRSKRDEVRSDRTGDQVLRMDFMRERRKWVDQKEKENGIWGNGDVDDMVDVDIDVDAEEDWDNGQTSPVEEREVDELAMQYDPQQQDNINEIYGVGSTARDAHIEEFSDDGYDEAFMEFLSQESGIVKNSQEHVIDVDGYATTVSSRLDGGDGGGGNGDFEMDMS